jgi:hypothetical protein
MKPTPLPITDGKKNIDTLSISPKASTGGGEGADTRHF